MAYVFGQKAKPANPTSPAADATPEDDDESNLEELLNAPLVHKIQPMGKDEVRDDILKKLQDLKQALEENAPGYEMYLRKIHTQLKDNPDITFMLSDEDIQHISKAIFKYKSISVTTKEAKVVAKKPSATNVKAAVANASIDLFS